MKLKLFAIFALFVFVSAFAQNALAEGGLVITPHRIVLEGRERQARVTLTNTGAETARFRLFFVNYRMSEAGEFEPVTNAAGEMVADKLIRYSPKQVELPPNATQIANLQIRLPANLPAGEYRSHLVFQAIPKQVEPLSTSKGRTRAAITTLYGVSIPVIVRRGTKPAKAAFGEIAFGKDEHGPFAEVLLTREGDQSLYGDIKFTWISAKGEEKVIGESNGLAVYTPLARRRVHVPLTIEKATLTGGKISVTYSDPGDPSQVFASKSIDVR